MTQTPMRQAWCLKLRGVADPACSPQKLAMTTTATAFTPTTTPPASQDRCAEGRRRRSKLARGTGRARRAQGTAGATRNTALTGDAKAAATRSATTAATASSARTRTGSCVTMAATTSATETATVRHVLLREIGAAPHGALCCCSWPAPEHQHPRVVVLAVRRARTRRFVHACTAALRPTCMPVTCALTSNMRTPFHAPCAPLAHTGSTNYGIPSTQPEKNPKYCALCPWNRCAAARRARNARVCAGMLAHACACGRLVASRRADLLPRAWVPVCGTDGPDSSVMRKGCVYGAVATQVGER